MPASTPQPIRPLYPVREPNRVVAALRGIGPVGIAVMLVVLVAAFVYGPMIAGPLVLLWALVTRSWRALGFVRPKSWTLTHGRHPHRHRVQALHEVGGHAAARLPGQQPEVRLSHPQHRGAPGDIAIVVITWVLFAAAPYPKPQWIGVTNALIMALIVGTWFAIKRNLWTLIVWHAAFDICALFMTYFDLNREVAHAIFR